MNLIREKLKRDRFLLTVYKLAQGDTGETVDKTALAEALKIEGDEFEKTTRYLTDEGHIKGATFTTISLTPSGRKDAERLIELPYKEKAFRVLWMIKELSNGSLTRLVLSEEVARMLAIEPREIYPIMNDLDERGLITALNEAVVMLPAGLEALESTGESSSAPDSPPPSSVFNINVHGDNYGPVQQGHGNVQRIVNNQSISEILPMLVEFIEAVRAVDFVDKDDAVADLEKVQILARGEINEGIWKRIQTKLTAAKMTMEIAGLAYSSYPHWPAIWAFFTK